MRTKLSEKYPQEREDICRRIIEILELNPVEKSFLLCELDADVEKQQKLLAMRDEIKRVFECSAISSFKNDFECKRPYLSLVRSILRKQGYAVNSHHFFVKYEGGLLKRTVKYVVSRGGSAVAP